MFGINPSEFIVLVAVAAVVLGPERLPEYAQSLARLVKQLRRMAQGASAQVREELGPEFDDIDWRKLDPRQYDPRRIVREALADTFDPEDPLGLKNDPMGLDTWDDDEDRHRDEKPQSAGGPAERTPAEQALPEPAASDDAAPGRPRPSFDPDVT